MLWEPPLEDHHLAFLLGCIVDKDSIVQVVEAPARID